MESLLDEIPEATEDTLASHQNQGDARVDELAWR